MAKASKPKKGTKPRGEYDEPLQVNGSFMDIMKAAAKHRAKNTTPPAHKTDEKP